MRTDSQAAPGSLGCACEIHLPLVPGGQRASRFGAGTAGHRAMDGEHLPGAAAGEPAPAGVLEVAGSAMACVAGNIGHMRAPPQLTPVSAAAPDQGDVCSFDLNANLTQTTPPPAPAGGGTWAAAAPPAAGEVSPRSHSIILADDHPSVRNGLKKLLTQHPGFDVVGEAGDGLAAIELVTRLRPDLLICDLSMPGLHGLEVTRRALAASTGTRVIVLSVHADEPYLVQALGCGASGYVLKSASSDHLLDAIRAALSGGRYLSPPFPPALLG